MTTTSYRNALPGGHSLLWYRLNKVLGRGSFGTTYLATDSNLDRQVAIKEYLPIDLAVREDAGAVQAVSPNRAAMYRWGLMRFIAEARTLAKFGHPNIVRVHSVFEANNTAYMVMAYEQGDSLDDLLRLSRLHGEAELLKILFPLLDALEHLHDAGYIHRDIKPKNIFIRADGSPVLLDFGSARMALGTQARTLTTFVTPGYAPYEQYDSESGKQGPWTDIYALGATLYKGVTGKAPVDAIIRINLRLKKSGDPLKPAVEAGEGMFSSLFLRAVDAALKLLPRERPATIAAWRNMFQTPDNALKDTASKSGAIPPYFSIDSGELEKGHPVITMPTELRTDRGIGTRSARRSRTKRSANSRRRNGDPPHKITMPAELRTERSIGGRSATRSRTKPRTSPRRWLGMATLMVSVVSVAAASMLVRQWLVSSNAGSEEPSVVDAFVAESGSSPSISRWPEPSAPGEAANAAASATVFQDPLSDGSQGPQMVIVPPGSFRMGDIQDQETGSEQPLHTVHIGRPFAIGKYEVTFEEYDGFARATGRNLPSDGGWGRGKRPVINVSWEDGVAYAKWLSEQAGKRYRLPSEAEWEYAARSGTETHYWWGNYIGYNRANCDGCGSQWDNKETAPVGSFEPNPFGLYDTAGNVWEWVQDCMSGSYAVADTHGSVRLPSACPERVFRGGSWNVDPHKLRSAKRTWDGPDLHYSYVGLRIARDL